MTIKRFFTIRCFILKSTKWFPSSISILASSGLFLSAPAPYPILDELVSVVGIAFLLLASKELED